MKGAVADNRIRRFSRAVATAVVLIQTHLLLTSSGLAQSRDDCFFCHMDAALEDADGSSLTVDPVLYEASVHAFFECVDCHTQSADFDDLPHFDRYETVDCSMCHPQLSDSFAHSFHGLALRNGTRNAPDCAACHSGRGNPHEIHQLDPRSAETACRQCHEGEAERYDASVHQAAYSRGQDSPGCISCHQTHSEVLPPSVGAINGLCEGCHPGSMNMIWEGDHGGVDEDLRGELSCASCHDVHATHRPSLDTRPLQACNGCHTQYEEAFRGSVHEELIDDNAMSCLSCHRSHQVADATEREQFGCGHCHEAVESEFRGSVHRLARLRGDVIAAVCGDCHGGHHVLPASDPESPVAHRNIPGTCGSCHTENTVVTTDYVRLPISLPNYQQSVHGLGLEGEKHTAVCTDCHGTHLLLSTSNPDSLTAKANIPNTCGHCHEDAADEFMGSVHGRAVAHGIADAPSCTECHDEHLIFATSDIRSRVNPINQASGACAQCHEDPEMAARYGLPEDVVVSFLDSYHGWAVQRGGIAAAVCEDCHGKHNIRSRLDPESSIHPDNVVETCRRCHPNSNPQFAASYTHVLARNRRMVHDWVRIIYVWLIVVVLGAMALHNLIIYFHELRRDYRHKKGLQSVRRWNRAEIGQHMVLLITFVMLALTGFALRSPTTWWVDILSELGLNEERRRLTHRVMAFLMVAASFYHLYYMLFTKRGRSHLKALIPRWSDAKDAAANIGYHVGIRRRHPEFATYDYTQKLEYWALIWGTAIMSISGVVLMYPDVVTQWFPSWIVRVGEAVHYYEAILAVSAVVVWHFFFVILLPREYPMSWIWLTGRQPKEEWLAHHGLAKERDGIELDAVEKDDETEGQ